MFVKKQRNDFSLTNKALCGLQSALRIMWFDGFEQSLSSLRPACELFLLPAGRLGFLHAAKFLGGVFHPQVSVSVERDADITVSYQVMQRLLG